MRLFSPCRRHLEDVITNKSQEPNIKHISVHVLNVFSLLHIIYGHLWFNFFACVDCILGNTIINNSFRNISEKNSDLFKYLLFLLHNLRMSVYDFD